MSRSRSWWKRSSAIPVFVKPCSLGSSVGIRKAKDEKELLAAVDLAFGYDNKIIIEKAIAMREIEVSVMGNDEIMVSAPGELLPVQGILRLRGQVPGRQDAVPHPGAPGRRRSKPG